jgi:Tol biopolymer transport system component
VSSAGNRIDWSPDSRQIVYSASLGSTAEVFIASAATGSARKVTDGADPDWSPDGRTILFSRNDPGFTLFGQP